MQNEYRRVGNSGDPGTSTPSRGVETAASAARALQGLPPPAGSVSTISAVPLPEGDLFAVLTHGVNGMPAFRSDLTARERWLVVAYLKTLK